MRKVTLYQCGICGEQYSDKAECSACEAKHVKPVEIQDMRYNAVCNDIGEYPAVISVKMADGKVITYKR